MKTCGIQAKHEASGKNSSIPHTQKASHMPFLPFFNAAAPIHPPPSAPAPQSQLEEEFMQVDIVARPVDQSPATVKPPATDPPTLMPSCTITSAIEKPAFAFGKDTTLLAMASLTAPAAPAAAAARPPLDLIAVVDRSGSMSGAKIELMRKTLTLLVTRAGLTSEDRFGCVSFDTTAIEEIAMQPMSAAGCQHAQEVIGRLAPGGSTNLSGGLLKGVDMLSQLPNGGGQGRTRAIMLFTDGLANYGIVETAPLVSALQGALGSAATSAACFTFGFGEQHNEDMLRAVAEATAAQYYFIQGVDDIPNSFADCLGGLVSIVVQNATLTLEPLDTPEAPYAIAKVLGQYRMCAAPSPVAHRLELGDLYAEDAKDVLFELRVPALGAGMEADLAAPTPVVRATLRYFHVANARFEEATTTLTLARPAATPPDQPCDLKLDAQRNRMLVAESMERAAMLGDAGQLAEGRAVLERCAQVVQCSPSRDLELCGGLVREVQQLHMQYDEELVYRSLGSKMSKMSAMSHQMQRSNHASAAMYEAGSSSKAAMKRAWATSTK